MIRTAWRRGDRCRRAIAFALLGAVMAVVGCSPTQLAPTPLLPLATALDAAQGEHAPDEQVDWLAVVEAHDRHLDVWESLRTEGATQWTLRPLMMEHLVGADEFGELPPHFGPWVRLLRRSHAVDRQLGDDLRDRRAADPRAVTAAMLRRHSTSGIVARAAEANEAIARGLTDLRLWLRIAAGMGDQAIPADVGELLAQHEREQTLLVDALEEAVLNHLRHFTVDGEWRGAVGHEPADGEPVAIPRVAWDALIRTVSITDAMVRLLHDSLAAILNRAEDQAADGAGGTLRRDLMLVVAAAVADLTAPDDEPDLATEEDLHRALVVSVALLESEETSRTLATRLLRSLEAESTLALRSLLLASSLSMAETLHEHDRAARQSVPTALRHLDPDRLRAELTANQRARQRQTLALLEELERGWGREGVEAVATMTIPALAARLQTSVGPAGSADDAVGAWRELPWPEPWRRREVDLGVPTLVRDERRTVADSQDNSDPSALHRSRMSASLGRYFDDDEVAVVDAIIVAAVRRHWSPISADMRRGGAHEDIDAATLRRLSEESFRRVEEIALFEIAAELRTSTDDPSLACLSLDWALARLGPERTFGTSEARRDHATSPTVVLDGIHDPTSRRIAAERIAAHARALRASAEHVTAALDRLAEAAKRDEFVEDSSTGAWTNRLGRPAGMSMNSEDFVPVPLGIAVAQAEGALAAHAFAVERRIVDALDALPPDAAARAWRAWTDVAFPMTSTTGTPDAVALCRLAGRSLLAAARERDPEFDHDDPDAVRDRIVALLSAADETEIRLDAWRRRTIEASHALRFIPIGVPTDTDLRVREAALWARHRLLETQIRGSLIALHHADGESVDEVRRALGWR